MIRRSLVILNPFSCPGTWTPTVWCLCSEPTRSLPRQRLDQDTGSNTDTKQPGDDLQRILRVVALAKENNESQYARSPQTSNRRSKADGTGDVQFRDCHTGGTVRYQPDNGSQNRLKNGVTQEKPGQICLAYPTHEKTKNDRCR